MSKRDIRLIGIILLAAFGYSIVRYHLFKGVSVEHFPLYITNKALSLAGLLLLGASRIVHEKERRKAIGVASLVTIALHAVISLQILTPRYFGKMHLADGTLTWNGEAGMLAGVAGLILLIWLDRASRATPLAAQSSGRSLVKGLCRAVLVMTALHVAFIGFAGWFATETWPGHLPPITLLSFLLAVMFLLLPKRNPLRAAPVPTAEFSAGS